MDEKTEELRDIFTSVTDEDTVTEEQTETHGSLTDGSSEALSEIVTDMRERYDFDADLSTDAYCRVARAFYDAERAGRDADVDAAIAEAADVDEETARRARLDLNLYVDADLDPGVDADRARELLADADAEAVAAELDADVEAVERFADAVAARDRSLRANHRFRDRFDEALADGDLTRQLTAEVTEDGLEEATEGMETDVEM